VVTKPEMSFTIIRVNLAKMNLRFGSLENEYTSGYLEKGYSSWPLISP